uniref:Transmembrane protein n=1 Tax=Glossina austeni TaxID=7395 RepID=A0A1A9VYY2_GLOAU
MQTISDHHNQIIILIIVILFSIMSVKIIPLTKKFNNYCQSNSIMKQRSQYYSVLLTLLQTKFNFVVMINFEYVIAMGVMPIIVICSKSILLTNILCNKVYGVTLTITKYKNDDCKCLKYKLRDFRIMRYKACTLAICTLCMLLHSKQKHFIRVQSCDFEPQVHVKAFMGTDNTHFDMAKYT